MKTNLKILSAILIAVFLSSCKAETKEAAPVKTDISEFVGQWTVDIENGSVGWIEVLRKKDYIDAQILWGGGSVLPVSNIFLAADRTLIIQRSNNLVRSRDENNNPVETAVVTSWLEIEKAGEDNFKGILLNPRRDGLGVDTTKFTGTKLPPVPTAPDLTKIKYGNPVQLFNGKDLTGWTLTNPKHVNGFKVVNGELVNEPVQTEGSPHIRYGNLKTEKNFEDFNLKLEVNVPAGSNSGVYLRGMYEIQVSDSYKKDLDSHNMGALYSRIKPSVSAEKPAGTWQTLDMTLVERHLTVLLNGVRLIDNQPIYGPTGGAIQSDVFSPGPVYLQGDHGKVTYRNIVLTPIIK